MHVFTHLDTQAITYDKFKADFRNARLKAKAYADENGLDFEWFQFKDLRAKAAADAKTHNDAQKLLGHRDSKTAAIYRRDKTKWLCCWMRTICSHLEKRSSEKPA